MVVRVLACGCEGVASGCQNVDIGCSRWFPGHYNAVARVSMGNKRAFMWFDWCCRWLPGNWHAVVRVLWDFDVFAWAKLSDHAKALICRF